MTKPCFWWLLGEIRLPPVTLQFENTFRVLEIFPQVVKRCWSEALEPGWKPFSVAHGLRTGAEFNFVCFAPFVPGNLKNRMATAYGCAVTPEIVREGWRLDDAAQSPFQYEDLNLVVARNGSSRELVSRELEALHRYPKGYTAPVLLFEGSKAGVANHLRDAPGLERLESERLRKCLIGNSWHVGVTEFWLKAFLTSIVPSDAAPTASMRHVVGQEVPKECPSRCQYNRARFPKNGLYIGRGVPRIGLKGSKWSNPYPLRLCSSRNDCLAKYHAYVLGQPSLMNALPELEGRVLLCHCPAGMRCHGDILISLWLDRYAVKQAPRSCASFPDPLPSSAGGLSGPQVGARNACDKLQQESVMEAEAADAGLKQVPRSLAPSDDTLFVIPVPLPSLPKSPLLDHVVKVGTGLRYHCPFLQWRFAHDRPVDDPLGPFPEDWDAHRVHAVAQEVQERHQGFGSSRQKIIEYGLDPESFYLQAVGTESPFALSGPLAEDLQFCVDTLLAQGANISQWRKRQWKRLQAAFADTKQWDLELNSARCLSSLRVANHLSPAAHEVARLSINWPDRDLATTLITGAHIVGPMQNTGIYRRAEIQAQTSEDELLFLSAARAHTMACRPPPRRDVARAVWEKSCAELESGVLEGWFTKEQVDTRFGTGNWSFMVRLAVWQLGSGSWRSIDDARASHHSRTFEATERIHTTSANVSMAFWRFLREQLGKPLSAGWQPMAGTKVMSKAYRQIPVSEEHLKHSVVCLWNPVAGKWVFAILHGLAFGLVWAVLTFNRYPAFISALARRWLAIPCTNFYDDFKVHTTAHDEGSASHYFNRLMAETGLGWRFDASKDHIPALKCRFLGTWEDYSATASDFVQMSPDAVKAAMVRDQLLLVLGGASLSRAKAASLHGKIQNFNSILEGKAGRSLTVAFAEMASGSVCTNDSFVKQSVQYWLEVFEMVPPPWRQIQLSGDNRRTLHVFGDAATGLSMLHQVSRGAVGP